MSQPYPSSGQPAGPLRPPAPAPVLTAVKLMYGGAAVTATVYPDHLAGPHPGDIKARAPQGAPGLTAAQVTD